VWDCIEEILSESRDCGRYQQDENAWCMKVVHPVLRLALKGSSALKVESVYVLVDDLLILSRLTIVFTGKLRQLIPTCYQSLPRTIEFNARQTLLSLSIAIHQKCPISTTTLVLPA
jgi:hypothetical protein